jgi:DNA-binding CsgD family transcriptional regulator
LRDPRVTAVVFVSDPAEARGPSETHLRQTYGLTPAEASVAARIAVGHGLADIATERGSALETVRRQSKQILAKTGARHRADLMRLLLALPQAVRTPDDPDLRTPPG